MAQYHDPTQVRTLHRLVLPARCHDPGEAPIRFGVYVDVETTGMDWARDAVVELALVPFTYTDDGRVAEVLHEEAQTYLSAPDRALPPEVAARTGLTDAALEGRHIDVAAANALIARADLVIAHNARFDRPFVERLVPAARERAWAFSRLEVPWYAEGCPSTTLDGLASHYGVYAPERHRALPDCETGLWLVAQRLPRSHRPVLAALLERVRTPTLRLWAVGAPPEARGVLRARGYRWMPVARAAIARSWWREVAPEMEACERAWLTDNVYGPGAPAPIVRRRVDALSRWRADPADCAGAPIPRIHRAAARLRRPGPEPVTTGGAGKVAQGPPHPVRRSTSVRPPTLTPRQDTSP